MNTGQVLGGALRLARRRRVLGLGMIVALFGLVYVALYVGLTLYNPNALAEVAESLTTQLPANWATWLGVGVVVLIVGGYFSVTFARNFIDIKPARHFFLCNEWLQH